MRDWLLALSEKLDEMEIEPPSILLPAEALLELWRAIEGGADASQVQQRLDALVEAASAD